MSSRGGKGAVGNRKEESKCEVERVRDKAWRRKREQMLKLTFDKKRDGGETERKPSQEVRDRQTERERDGGKERGRRQAVKRETEKDNEEMKKQEEQSGGGRRKSSYQ